MGTIIRDGKNIDVIWNNCEKKGGFKMLNLPKLIPRSRRSPMPLELSWLHHELGKYNLERKISNVLEYSGGITSWVTYDAIKPENYICVEREQFKRIFGPVTELYPEMNVVHNWYKIPEMEYDLVFVDGSSCIPKKLKKELNLRGSVHRMEALIYSEQFHRVGSDGTLVVFHDWGHPAPNSGWRAIKKYCKGSEKYEFLQAFKMGVKGFGIFRRVK